MNISKCLCCSDAQIEDDCVKCLYGHKSYPDNCPKENLDGVAECGER
jgi:hypothetical protein